jgi:hypothetical protein
MYKKIRLKVRQFNHWLKYSPPGSLTSKGWRLFEKEFEQVAPVRYRIKKHLQKRYAIQRRLSDIKYWFLYRTTKRYHVIDSGLPPGYHSIDNLMLHSSFNMLKDFVEVETAYHLIWTGEERIEMSWFEKYMPFYYTFFPFRRPELGLKHLDWAATLDDPALPPHARSDIQAQHAREIKALYFWWIEIRPSRKEIETMHYDDQGLGTLSCFDDDFDKNAPDYVAHCESMKQRQDQEEEWKDEDTEYLIRLVKIREGLWT